LKEIGDELLLTHESTGRCGKPEPEDFESGLIVTSDCGTKDNAMDKF